MTFLDLVKQRYSCRSYQEKSVEQEKLDYVMECVRLAPSAVNKQPWMFRLVKDEAEKAKLRECYNRDWFNSAPMYIICSILHDHPARSGMGAQGRQASWRHRHSHCRGASVSGCYGAGPCHLLGVQLQRREMQGALHLCRQRGACRLNPHRLCRRRAK